VKISFCFSGWVTDVEVTHLVVTETGKKILVADLTKREVAAGLNDGSLLIPDFDSVREDAGKQELSLFDFSIED
jgi:hypothetical protein